MPLLLGHDRRRRSCSATRLLPDAAPRRTMPADLSAGMPARCVDQYGLDRAADAGSTRRRRRAPRPGHRHRRGHRSRPARRSSARRSSRAWSPTAGDLVVLAIQRQRRGHWARRDRRSPPATPSCSRARGRRSTSTPATRACSSSTTPELVRRQAVPLGLGRRRGARDPRRGWSSLLATGIVPSAVAGLLAAGALVVAAGGDVRGGLPRHLVDDGRARGRDDPAVHGDDPDRRGGPHRRRAGRRRRRPRAVRAAGRAVRRHRRVRAADQQHGHGADRDPDRGRRRRASWASTSSRC